ncbi:hypothetical protein [Paracidovorax valerianellae]|nr:hypothetical protein [Paracidovorax valerianellae]MDA8447416.1 hypothetical protein [Paracidovorax valerianellae]
MTLKSSLNKLQHAMRPGGSALAEAPAAKSAKPGGKSSAFAGFSGLQGRDGGAQSGGMAPRSMNALRGRAPMAQALSNAAQHARDSVQQFSQGMRQEIKQHKNGFSALRAESHQMSRPGFGYGAVAQHHRTAQTAHQQRSQQAYANAAQSARGFFGETARGVSAGVRGAAYSVAKNMERFDPRRLAHKASHYGNAVLHKAGQAAMVGLGGALLAGVAVTHGVDRARYKMGQMAHAANHAVNQGVNHAMYRVDHAVQSAAHRIDNALYRVDHAVNQVSHAAHSVAYQAGYMAQNAINHVTYPIRAAAHTYQSLAHAASVFKQDMAHFNAYGMQHSYQQYHARPQWY